MSGMGGALALLMDGALRQAAGLREGWRAGEAEARRRTLEDGALEAHGLRRSDLEGAAFGCPWARGR